MALISRVSRLLRADLHAVLDHLEEPDVLLRQALREMEEALASDATRLKRVRHELEQLARRQHELQQEIGQIDGELDICFDAEEHELARSLCRRKLESEQLLDSVNGRRECSQQEREALQERCREQQLQFESMRQKAELFTVEAHDAGEGVSVSSSARVLGDAVEVAFLREQRKRRAP